MRDIAGIRLDVFAAVITAATLLSSPAMAQDRSRDLTELDLEELMSIDITLASRREETMLESAAAVEGFHCAGFALRRVLYVHVHPAVHLPQHMEH